MRLYLAGTMHDPRFLNGTLPRQLRVAGHTIVSRWHEPGVWRSEDRQTDALRQRIARDNLANLAESDMLLAVPLAGHHLRGMHLEMGYALGRGIPVHVLGGHRDVNTMGDHPTVTFHQELPSWLAKPHG